MGIRQVFGILVCSVQAVVAADYYFQTRDAGLQWGELSSARYAEIVRLRYSKEGWALAALPQETGAQPADNSALAQKRGADLTGEATQGQNSAEDPARICVRRGTERICQ